MKKALLLTTLGVLPILAAPAFAACGGTAPTFTCADTDTDGFNAGNGTNDATITVNSGVTVSNAGGDAIRARGTGNTVINHGTIAGTAPAGSDGVDGGIDLTVINHGAITATNKGIDADDLNGLTVENYGTIESFDKAIRNGDGAGSSLYNGVGAVIESQVDEGFESGDDAIVENHGRISASDDAVQVGENAQIDNYGIIESLQRGGDEADPQDGIDIDSGTITNHAGAVIRSDDDAAIDYDGSTITSYIDNHGTISGTYGVLVETGLDHDTGLPNGEEANTAAQIITNYGVIEGKDGTALYLGEGDDSLTWKAGSSLIGGAEFGAGEDSLIFDSLMTGFAAGGSILDGGAGKDTVSLLAYVIDDVLSAMREGTVVTLTLFGADGDFTLRLASWQRYAFADGTLSNAQLVGSVPLPGGLALSLGGLAALAGLRRRRTA